MEWWGSAEERREEELVTLRGRWNVEVKSGERARLQ